MVATIAKINLLPPYLIDQSMGQYRSRWSWALAIMMLVSLSFIIDLTIKQAIFRSQQQQQRLQMALHQIQVTEQQRDVVRQQFQTMLAFLTKQQSRQSTAQTAQHFLQQLPTVLPADAYLTELVFSQQQFFLVGHINSQLNLAELLRMMAQMPMVSKVDLRQLKPVNAGNPELIFEIIAWIKPSIGTTE